MNIIKKTHCGKPQNEKKKISIKLNRMNMSTYFINKFHHWLCTWDVPPKHRLYC